MVCIGIVGGGPQSYIPRLHSHSNQINSWIGTDRGALTLLTQDISPDIAIGDFDSVTAEDKGRIKKNARQFKEFPAEKNETDLELAVMEAIKQNPERIYFFGVTGGRLDHELANIQLLYRLLESSISGIIVDCDNQLELKEPGVHEVSRNSDYPFLSFIPFTKQVLGISLTGFYYTLDKADISWGSTLCISNKLILEKGTFSFDQGILIVIKSRDVLADPL